MNFYKKDMESTTALRLTKINAVCTRYYASSDVEEIRDSDNKLVGLREPDLVILKHTVLATNNSAFKVSFIIYRGTNIYDLYAMESTDSSIFLAPVIASKRATLSWDVYYMNTFLYKEHVELPQVRMLFRKGVTDGFKDLDRSLRSHSDFLDSEDMDEYSIMYNFRIPAWFKNDFKLLIDSKYSELSDEYKSKITKFHTLRKGHDIYGILYKTKARRKHVEEKIGQSLPEAAELYHILKKSRETYHDVYRITDRDLGPDLKSLASKALEAGSSNSTREEESHSDPDEGLDFQGL